MAEMKDVLDDLWREGKDTLDIYFAEDISPGDESWFVDVMQDEINERLCTDWTWTIITRKELGQEEKEEQEKEDIPDWMIIIDKPFSEIIVKGSIENWLRERGYKFNVSLIPFENAKGSGYVKKLKERLEDKDIEKLGEIGWA